MAERKPKQEKEEKLDAEAVEPKKRPRRKAKSEKEDKLEAESVTPETEAAEDPDAGDEPDAESPDATEEPAEDKPKRRRGSAQTTAAETTAAGTKKTPPPRSPDGDVVVRASARFVRCAPRKARLVVDHIRGKDVEHARAILTHTPRAASQDVLRLLNSAIANAENNHELVADELRVKQIVVNEGPTLKRYRPRALGRATQIKKRTSHMSITLSPKE